MFISNNQAHTTVRFKIASGVYWERIINQKSCEIAGRKANFIGSYSGKVWQIGKIDPTKPVFFCEGVFDAIALNNMKLQAVATIMSSVNYPSEFIATLPKTAQLVWAFDNDVSGKKQAIKFTAKAQKQGYRSTLMLPISDKGADWNDILIQYGSKCIHILANQLLASQFYSPILEHGLIAGAITYEYDTFVLSHFRGYYSVWRNKEVAKGYQISDDLPAKNNFFSIIDAILSNNIDIYNKISFNQISNITAEIGF